VPEVRASRDLRNGRLAENIIYFARLLRDSGLSIGPGDILHAVEAVETIGVADRDDFYWALHAVLIRRHEDHQLFHQAFQIFWRNPRFLEQMRAALLPQVRAPVESDMPELIRRLVEAVTIPGDRDTQPEDRVEFDAELTTSAEELLASKDFEQMSTEELLMARRMLRTLELPQQQVETRRFKSHPSGARIDLRRTIRDSMRTGGNVVQLRMRKRIRRKVPIVILCDISGSMSRYSRMVLHFAHSLANNWDRVHTFTFGTRLTNITRHLQQKDVDKAVDQAAAAVKDWEGGTRIGACLRDFNHRWSRRVLTQNPIVLLVTDGLDRENADDISEQIERVQRSCRRLIWLNPLLRFEHFEPLAAGVKALLPNVDDFRPAHNIESLVDLGKVLSANKQSGRFTHQVA
jgi:uncharacterized protein with von Willebrand factor type A (vWA) domain